MNNLIELSRSFCAMSTGVEAVVCVPETRSAEAEQALTRVQNIFVRMEKRFSRFLETSELTQLNQSSGNAFKASADLFNSTAASLKAAQITNGIVDPCILPDLLAAGYDCSYELLGNSRNVSSVDRKVLEHPWKDILLIPGTHSIFLPKGCSLDLGGIAKSWTVDRAARRLNIFQNYAINAGGDMVVQGRQVDGSPWKVGIEDPLKRRITLGVLELSGGAVCTSSVMQRRWKVSDIWMHHLIDPRTGLPADSGIIACTVVAGTALLAETLAKAALILGPRDGLQLIEKHAPAQGMLIMENGRRLFSSDFRKMLLSSSRK
jgi:FAD:protein FMN transferase